MSDRVNAFISDEAGVESVVTSFSDSLPFGPNRVPGKPTAGSTAVVKRLEVRITRWSFEVSFKHLRDLLTEVKTRNVRVVSVFPHVGIFQDAVWELLLKNGLGFLVFFSFRHRRVLADSTPNLV